MGNPMVFYPGSRRVFFATKRANRIESWQDKDSRIHRHSSNCLTFFSDVCMDWVVPPPCNSRKGFTFWFNRGLLLTSFWDCYRVGAVPNVWTLFDSQMIFPDGKGTPMIFSRSKEAPFLNTHDKQLLLHALFMFPLRADSIIDQDVVPPKHHLQLFDR